MLWTCILPLKLHILSQMSWICIARRDLKRTTEDILLLGREAAVLRPSVTDVCLKILQWRTFCKNITLQQPQVAFSSARISLFLKAYSWKQHFFPEHIKTSSLPTPSEHAKQLKAITTVLGFLLFTLHFINLISPSISSYSSYSEESPWKEKEIYFLSHCPVAGMVGVKPEAVFTTQINQKNSTRFARVSCIASFTTHWRKTRPYFHSMWVPLFRYFITVNFGAFKWTPYIFFLSTLQT